LELRRYGTVTVRMTPDRDMLESVHFANEAPRSVVIARRRGDPFGAEGDAEVGRHRLERIDRRRGIGGGENSRDILRVEGSSRA
jgi:hypothetical protein